jgi:hypothetical protein
METSRKSSAGGIVDNMWKQSSRFDSPRKPFCVSYPADIAEREARMVKIRFADEMIQLKSLF